MMNLFFLLSSLASASDVTAQNWKTHPEITEIRMLRKSIERNVVEPTWTTKKENLSTCAANRVSKRSLILDNNGTVRRYKAHGTDNGTSFWTTQYYGPTGKLRFVQLKLTHVDSNSTADYTSFLDIHGQRLFEHVQRTTDDQKLHPSGIPEDMLMFRPDQVVKKKYPCG